MKLSRSAATVATLVVSGAFGLAACHPAPLGKGRNRADRPVTVAARLECPDRQGDLERVSVAADGRSCQYRDGADREAVLKIVDLDGRDPASALAPAEAELKSLVPGAAAPGPGPAPPGPPAPPGAKGDREHVRIDLPGVHIDTDDHDGAHIRAFGQIIDAKDKGAVIKSGWNGKNAIINAHDGGVEMRFGFIGKAQVDSSYILAADTPGPQGYRAAGYVARGPATGPLVLGVETSKAADARDDHDDGRQYKDLRRLVDRNVSRR